MSRVKSSWLPQGLVKAMGLVPYAHSLALVGTTSGDVLVNDMPFGRKFYDVIIDLSKVELLSFLELVVKN